MESLKKSVSDGKSSLASAITAQGVTTTADATFATMANNIATACTNKFNAGKSQGTIKYVGATGQQYGGSIAFNVTSTISNYAELTNANFITVLDIGGYSNKVCEGDALSWSYSLPVNSHSYNASTGVLTINMGWLRVGTHNNSGYGVDRMYNTLAYIYAVY